MWACQLPSLMCMCKYERGVWLMYVKVRTLHKNYGVFTMTETETEPIPTPRRRQRPIKCYRTQWIICIGVCLGAVWTPPHNHIQAIFIGLAIGLGICQCEHTVILPTMHRTLLGHFKCMNKYFRVKQTLPSIKQKNKVKSIHKEWLFGVTFPY